MGMIKNYNYKIQYNPSNNHEELKNILNGEQLSQLNDFNKVFLIENVYCKINNINGSKENIEISVDVYKDKEIKLLIERKTYSFIPSLDSPCNFIKQGYDYLKTLDEYKDAVDC